MGECYYCGKRDCICDTKGHKSIKPVQQLAEEHWAFIAGMFTAMDEGLINIETVEFLYKAAMIHGYKHCEQDLIKTKDM